MNENCTHTHTNKRKQKTKTNNLKTKIFWLKMVVYCFVHDSMWYMNIKCIPVHAHIFIILLMCFLLTLNFFVFRLFPFFFFVNIYLLFVFWLKYFLCFFFLMFIISCVNTMMRTFNTCIRWKYKRIVKLHLKFLWRHLCIINDYHYYLAFPIPLFYLWFWSAAYYFIHLFSFLFQRMH